MTETGLNVVHVFPSEESYEKNIDSVTEKDLALIPIPDFITSAEVKELIAKCGITDGDTSNENAWWLKLGGAVPIIVQGGYNQVQRTVSFPIAFPTKCLSVIATLARGDEEAAQTYNYTKSDFYLHQRYGDRWAHWISIGD